MAQLRKFTTGTGKVVYAEREIKTLKLVDVYNTDRYRNKNHDRFEFRDNENKYYYDAALNAEMTEYDSKIAKDLMCEEGKFIKLSGYFVPMDDYIYIYNPRLLEIQN